MLVFVADAVIPVAHFLGAIMVLGRVLAPATPTVKCLPPLGIEVFAVLAMSAARECPR
jgi:hypothetical protein